MKQNTDLAAIKRHLAGKRIFVLPYCHDDHAWCHSRAWHIKRYIAVFDRVVDLLRERPDFRYFIDSWSQLLEPCLKARPQSVAFLRQMLAEGRLALTGGHWSNIRFAHVDEETSVRNMIYGQRKVRELFPDARLDVYANLDVAIGHSQVPQLIGLGGYRYYFAWRPQKRAGRRRRAAQFFLARPLGRRSVGYPSSLRRLEQSGRIQ